MIKFLQAAAGYILAVGLVCNCIYIYNLQQDLMGLRGTIVDLDKLRSQYMYQMNAEFILACRQGIDSYPEAYRNVPVGEFNEHSPVIWCNEQAESRNTYIVEQMLQLGK